MSTDGPRVVSLLCAATEIVSALGQRDLLVGRSHECDFPPGVEDLPVCTEPRFDIAGDTRAIQRDVAALVRDGLSIYTVDVPALERLRPDLILTQDQCAVCAVDLPAVEEAVESLTGRDAEIVSLRPNRLEDVWADMRRIARALDTEAAGEALIERLRGRIASVERRIETLDERPTVGVLEWIDPPMGAGNWMPQLIAMAGGVPLFGETGAHSPWLEWQDVAAADPDVILIAPCGLDMQRAEADARLLAARPGWERLTAVRAGRVFIADGHQYFNRPGPRLADSVEILAEIIHPKTFEFGYRGRAWDGFMGVGHKADGAATE
jgi:iron complex transport system substrate-binding protein